MLKIVALLSVVVAAQAAVVVLQHPGAWWPSTSSSAFQSKDGFGNYAFGYHDGRWGQPSFHKESGDASGRKVGSYGVHDADGKVRVVNYVADANGFNADVQTNDNVVHHGSAVAHANPLWALGHHQLHHLVR